MQELNKLQACKHTCFSAQNVKSTSHGVAELGGGLFDPRNKSVVFACLLPPPQRNSTFLKELSNSLLLTPSLI